MAPLEIEILHTPNCPHRQAVRRRIDALARDEGIPVVVHETSIDGLGQARARHFPGSPTVLIEGRDIEPRAPRTPADYGLG